MNKRIITSGIVIWGSFLALLIFYILQKGEGLHGMEKPFFNDGCREDQYLTNIWLNICAFAFITIAFTMIYVTKLDKSLRSLFCYKSDIILLVIILSLFVAKAFFSVPASELKPFYPIGEAARLLMFEGLAILSIPSLLFVTSWVREIKEKSTSILDSKVFFGVCVSVAVLGIGILIYYCFSRDNWRDESSTLFMVKYSFDDMLASSASDVHPPLYYMLAWFAIKLGQFIFPGSSIIYPAKLISMVPLLILVLISATFIRKKWGWYVGGMCAIATVGMPLMLTSGQMVRMYSYSMLWVACIWLCAYMVCTHNRWRDWIFLGIFGALQAYTQYGFCVAVAPLYIYLFVWSIRTRCVHRWCLMTLGMAAAFIPWLLILQHYRHTCFPYNPSWIKLINIQQFCNLILLSTKDIIVLFIVGVVWVTLFQKWCCKKIKTVTFALIGILIPFSFVLLMSLISCIHTPVIFSRTRYIMPLVWVMWGGVVVAVYELRLRNLRILLTLMMFFVAASELNAFARIQRHGRDGANAMYNFFKNKPNALIISNKSIISPSSVSIITERPLYSCDPRPVEGYLRKAIGKDVILIAPEDFPKLMAEGKELYFRPHEKDSMRDMKAVLPTVGLRLAKPFYHYYKGKTKYAFHRIERIPKKKAKADKKQKGKAKK